MTGTTAGTDLVTSLVRLTHLVEQVFAEVSRDHGLTPQQTQLLCVLVDGPRGMTELRGALDLEKSGLSGLVDRVERRGLLARVRDTGDRRACQVELTCDGVELATTAHDDVTARLERLAGDVTPAERKALTVAVERILATRER